MQEERFPDASCPRCHALAQLYTVPLSLIPPSAEEAWQALCGECFRAVLETEPDDGLLMRPISHARRSRR
jgi:hypothetical protein